LTVYRGRSLGGDLSSATNHIVSEWAATYQRNKVAQSSDLRLTEIDHAPWGSVKNPKDCSRSTEVFEVQINEEWIPLPYKAISKG
jgi:hypothetical protein